MEEENNRFQVLINQLYWCFRGAYKENLSLEKLYKKGLEIEEKIEYLYPDFLERENSLDLKEALGFIEQLHEESSRKYNSENKEQLYYHMKRLR